MHRRWCGVTGRASKKQDGMKKLRSRDSISYERLASSEYTIPGSPSTTGSNVNAVSLQ